MASKRGGGGGGKSGGGGSTEPSNTGLIVSLVLFVLISIGLGAGMYVGFTGQEDLRKAASDAQKKEQAANKHADEEEAQKLALRIALGVASPADKTTFNGRKANHEGKIKEQIAALKPIEGFNWDTATTPTDTPPKTVLALLTDTRGSMRDLQASTKVKVDGLDADKVALNTRVDELSSKVKVAEDAQKKAHGDVDTAEKRHVAGSDTASKNVKELARELEELKVAKQNLDAEKSADIKKRDERVASLEKQLNEMRDKVSPLIEKIGEERVRRPEVRDLAELHDLLLRTLSPFDSIANDAPKGEIFRVAANEGLVYINLGSADLARPGLTFSVMPAGSSGRAAGNRDRKGAIEVVSVLEPHLSTAKVLDLTNAMREPLLPKDALFNPAWSPAQREHVALAGIFDLNGDGIDDTADLIRTLEKQGVIVDAHLDLKDRTIKGAGMNEKTTYLIVGDRPEYPRTSADVNNPIIQAAVEVDAKIIEMKKKATELGVQTVSSKRFLTLVGFKLPKQPLDLSQSSYLRGATGGKIKASDAGTSDTPK